MANPSKEYLENCIRDGKMSDFVVRMGKLKTDLDRSNNRLHQSKASIVEIQRIHKMQFDDAVKRMNDLQRDHDDAKAIYEYAQKLLDNKDNVAKVKQMKDKIERAIKDKNIPFLRDIESYFAKIRALIPEEQKWINMITIAVNHYIKEAEPKPVVNTNVKPADVVETADKNPKKKKSLMKTE